jgi:prepilin-type N-terminal cleavage/methylation domain-containing protein
MVNQERLATGTNEQDARAGFTILELLCAMAVLLIIVMMMGEIFTHSSRAWEIGTGQAENNTAGRAAIEFLARELSQAIAGSNCTFAILPDRDELLTYGMDNDEICFVAASHDPDFEDPESSERAVREIYYWIRQMKDGRGQLMQARYELARGHYGEEISQRLDDEYKTHCYHNPDWWLPRRQGGQDRPEGEVLVENVAGLRFYSYGYDEKDEEYVYSEEGYYSDDDYAKKEGVDQRYGDKLPLFVDIFLEVLTEQDAIRAAAMAESDQIRYVEDRARRYSARVHFNNRDGYEER